MSLNIFAQSTTAQSSQVGVCTTDLCKTNLPSVSAGSTQVTTVLQILFGVVAVLALIYVILAGLKLITSSGDPQSVAKGRQQILFAIIGLVVALSAELIISFVINRL
ncbi:MAG TPA: hypothetical protein PKA02_00045 [Candidatus Saccharibacteria bacterium]|nr:hypothetical protein [Candidatus Saccharibacteria bacterium]